jgi:hypothetical protein
MARKKTEEVPEPPEDKTPEPEAAATPEAATEGGKGKKRCAKCNSFVGVRSRECPICHNPFPPPAAKGEPRTRSASAPSASPTLDMVMLAKLRAEETGSVGELLNQVEELLDLANEFQGLDNLHKCLKFLVDMGAK